MLDEREKAFLHQEALRREQKEQALQAHGIYPAPSHELEYLSETSRIDHFRQSLRRIHAGMRPAQKKKRFNNPFKRKSQAEHDAQRRLSRLMEGLEMMERGNPRQGLSMLGNWFISQSDASYYLGALVDEYMQLLDQFGMTLPDIPQQYERVLSHLHRALDMAHADMEEGSFESLALQALEELEDEQACMDALRGLMLFETMEDRETSLFQTMHVLLLVSELSDYF